MQKVELIETLVQEQFNKTCFSDPLEACLVNSCDFNFDENSKIFLSLGIYTRIGSEQWEIEI